ncbi:hypothetical protein KDA82_33040, partial [Streptomyces daliensis]|nr:hypothetical protein [Streptomyces daliensis]
MSVDGQGGHGGAGEPGEGADATRRHAGPDSESPGETPGGPYTAPEAGAPGGEPEREGSDEFDEDPDELVDFLKAPRDGSPPYSVVWAPGGTVNTGSVRGGQHMNSHGAAGSAGKRVESHEGPIPPEEILSACAGFAEPAWFPGALDALRSRLLFLAGAPGSGRRTAGLNLLHRRTSSMALRAVDSDEDLAYWFPTGSGTRGYLVDGLLSAPALKAGVVGELRRRLHDADACMVIVLPDTPGLLRDLERELHVTPIRCIPPPPREVFDARLADAVPDPAGRAALLNRLEPGLLDELLAPELVPAQVAELVNALVASAASDGDTDAADIRDRLSFLAEEEVPDLLKELLHDADCLAFLLAACVFEGLDQRIVREEAERLLALADGRLHAVLPPHGTAPGAVSGTAPGTAPADADRPPRPNPAFVFRHSLRSLLHQVRAECDAKEIRSGPGYSYAVEPVRFTRHRQAESVLRHVWREYGQLSGLLTEWLAEVKRDGELTRPVGQVMGMAARWGGGRSALRHIRTLAKSDRATSRHVAAVALGTAAQDPVVASEVKHWLTEWSWAIGWQLRWTVAHTCGTDFGVSRPDLALRLLRTVVRGRDDGDESKVELAARLALAQLFASGNQALVLAQVAAWADSEGPEAGLSLRTFPGLLASDMDWFCEQLLSEGEFTLPIVALVQRALNDDDLFEATSNTLLHWCRTAAGHELRHEAVVTLLALLAEDMQRGAFRLFVKIDRSDAPGLVGVHIARRPGPGR